MPAALDHDLAEETVEPFCYLSRTALVKDEGFIDRFDRIFAQVFAGLNRRVTRPGGAGTR